jgi:hypothetical protein
VITDCKVKSTGAEASDTTRPGALSPGLGEQREGTDKTGPNWQDERPISGALGFTSRTHQTNRWPSGAGGAGSSPAGGARKFLVRGLNAASPICSSLESTNDCTLDEGFFSGLPRRGFTRDEARQQPDLAIDWDVMASCTTLTPTPNMTPASSERGTKMVTVSIGWTPV